MMVESQGSRSRTTSPHQITKHLEIASGMETKAPTVLVINHNMEPQDGALWWRTLFEGNQKETNYVVFGAYPFWLYRQTKEKTFFLFFVVAVSLFFRGALKKEHDLGVPPILM